MGTFNSSKWEADIWGWLEVRSSSHSKPASALGSPTVWSLWRNPRMARCWAMSILLSGYILQCKVTSPSSSGSLGFTTNFHCVWSVVGWLMVYQDGNYLYPGRYTQTIWQSQIMMILLPSGWEYYHGKTKYIPGKQILVRSWLWKTKSEIFGPNVADKYSSNVTKNLGLGCNSRPCP